LPSNVNFFKPFFMASCHVWHIPIMSMSTNIFDQGHKISQQIFFFLERKKNPLNIKSWLIIIRDSCNYCWLIIIYLDLLNLWWHNRQHLCINSVKLIKTTPCSTLDKPWEDWSHCLENTHT
jgi:hypothetical protein